MNMPILNGVEATKQMSKQYPDCRIVILTMHDDESYVIETLKSDDKGRFGLLGRPRRA